MDSNKIPEFKSVFQDELRDMIIYKRNSGLKYGRTNVDMCRKLDEFFIDIQLNEKIIDYEIYDQWMKTIKTFTTSTRLRYHSAISSFCEYLRINSYENIIQPETLNITYKSKFIPYIFNENEIERIFKLLSKDVSNNKDDVSRKYFYTLFCLFYGAGLRHMEALKLKKEDYNYEAKTITISESKNNVSRQIPLTDSIAYHIEFFLDYVTDGYIFYPELTREQAKARDYYYFHSVLKRAMIPVRYDGKRQRIHDLRHTFCINALKQMEDKGFDLYVSLAILSTYMGHKHINETEYYLRMVKSEGEKVIDEAQHYMSILYENNEGYYNGE